MEKNNDGQFDKIRAFVETRDRFQTIVIENKIPFSLDYANVYGSIKSLFSNQDTSSEKQPTHSIALKKSVR